MIWKRVQAGLRFNFYQRFLGSIHSALLKRELKLRIDFWTTGLVQWSTILWNQNHDACGQSSYSLCCFKAGHCTMNFTVLTLLLRNPSLKSTIFSVGTSSVREGKWWIKDQGSKIKDQQSRIKDWSLTVDGKGEWYLKVTICIHVENSLILSLNKHQIQSVFDLIINFFSASQQSNSIYLDLCPEEMFVCLLGQQAGLNKL